MARRFSLGNTFANWQDSDLAIVEKTRLVIKNNLIKARTGAGCCGNHGEPGC